MMMMIIPLIPFLLIISSTAAPLAAPPLCRKNDAAALLDVKRTFRVTNKDYLGSWLVSSECCSWRGVSCNARGDIVGLDLSSPYLSSLGGPISPSLANLSSITSLALSANITGSIPPFLSKLTGLTSLSINYNNNLTGPIPKELCALKSLAVLDLSYNSLTGQIPGCFGKNLVVMSIIHNRLSGPIPASIMLGAVPNPKVNHNNPALLLLGNRLAGPIPRTLADVPLKSLLLSDNVLTGDASFLFKELSSLEDMDLDGNQLEFDLSKVKFPLRLRSINLSRNKIYGSIPQQITKLGRLDYLNLSYNRLCGPIPTAGAMKSIDKMAFANNKCLCGGPLKPCH